ncbi:riboflavin synthase domain-like protein [Ramicandelaber brevisporus]|nr:riboflavin synthase domain-like protein [Ramicandelaber brevisporus]
MSWTSRASNVLANSVIPAVLSGVASVAATAAAASNAEDGSGRQGPASAATLDQVTAPPLFETGDALLLTAVLGGAAAYVFRDRLFGLQSKSPFADPKRTAAFGSSSSANGSASTRQAGAFASAAGGAGAGGRKAGPKLKNPRDFIEKMIATDKNAVVFYGSQTGTAEDFATRFVKEGAQKYGLKALVADFDDCDMELLAQLPYRIPNHLVVFMVATYGEGEPTDNAAEFWNLLIGPDSNPSSDLAQSTHKPLKHLQFAVFGLGNRTYEHFNAISKKLDQKLTLLGATRLGERGEGDDDANLEEDFLSWKADAWEPICAALNLGTDGLTSGGRPELAFNVAKLTTDDGSTPALFTGELTRAPAASISDLKNPYYARVRHTRNLFSDDADRKCLHVEVEISPTGSLRYNPGDHIAFWPVNPENEVQRLLQILGLSAEQNAAINVTATDPASAKKSPFPVPTTYATALRHYLEICAPPSREFIASTDVATGSKAAFDMLSAIGLSRDLYLATVGEYRWSLAELLERVREYEIAQGTPESDLFSVPFAAVCEGISRVNPRYYSISSTPSRDSTSVHVTAVVLDYQPGSANHTRTVHGVCTNYLYAAHELLTERNVHKKHPFANVENSGKYGLTPYVLHPTVDGANIYVPVYIRQSNFRLPRNPLAPIIMIGPGTGVAPFRGFIQERAHLARKGTKVGPALLFFGCRSQFKDYLYADEWPAEFESMGGTANECEIITAFSRDSPDGKKVYVQHRLEERRAQVWSLLSGKNRNPETTHGYTGGGYIYVCGDAKNMARDVNKWFQSLAETEGGMPTAKAESWVRELRAAGRYQEDVWS